MPRRKSPVVSPEEQEVKPTLVDEIELMYEELGVTITPEPSTPVNDNLGRIISPNTYRKDN